MADYIVRKFEEIDIQPVLEFMSHVTDTSSVDQDILRNASLVFENEQVAGMVSYERISEMGVIRYFIYNHYSLPDLLVNMFFDLYKEARDAGITRLVAVVSNPHAYQLFELLGFTEVKHKEEFKIPQLQDFEQASVMSIQL